MKANQKLRIPELEGEIGDREYRSSYFDFSFSLRHMIKIANIEYPAHDLYMEWDQNQVKYGQLKIKSYSTESCYEIVKYFNQVDLYNFFYDLRKYLEEYHQVSFPGSGEMATHSPLFYVKDEHKLEGNRITHFSLYWETKPKPI